LDINKARPPSPNREADALSGKTKSRSKAAANLCLLLRFTPAIWWYVGRLMIQAARPRCTEDKVMFELCGSNDLRCFIFCGARYGAAQGIWMTRRQCGHLSRTWMGVGGSSDMSNTLFSHTGQETTYAKGSSMTAHTAPVGGAAYAVRFFRTVFSCALTAVFAIPISPP
jgi:hypothetical protein